MRVQHCRLCVSCVLHVLLVFSTCCGCSGNNQEKNAYIVIESSLSSCFDNQLTLRSISHSPRSSNKDIMALPSPSSEMGFIIPSPILWNEGSPFQDVLTCTLCCEIPLEPVITPCHHIFCRPCIVRALQTRHECPNDRNQLQGNQLQAINGALRRIWECVPVRCPTDNCGWTGNMGNYAAHARRCMPVTFESAQDYERRIGELESKLQELRVQLETVEERREQDLEQMIARLREMYERDKEEAIAVLSKQYQNKWDEEVAELQAAFNGPQCDADDYQYDRFRVVELTQLICRNLEGIPSNVSRNRIYDCVRACYDDVGKDWEDSPCNFLMNVRMLLNVCRASTWFSPKQLATIDGWCDENGW